MLDLRRSLHYLIPLGLLFWSLSYFFNYADSYTAVIGSFTTEEELLVNDIVQHQIDDPFDGSAIASLCAKQKWIPNMILSCDPPFGGIGQVKSAHLTCVRMAIEMGAELIMPEILKRYDHDITKVLSNSGTARVRPVPLDYFFDYDHFNQTMSSSCPQMKLHRSIHELYDRPSLLNPIKFTFESVNIPRVNGVIDDPVVVPHRVREFIDKEWPVEKRKSPVRFSMESSFWTWPTSMDGPLVAGTFGRILLIREDVRQLAASALLNMQKRFSIDLDPRKQAEGSGSFVGIHMRTEMDVTDETFPSYATQAAYYFDYISKLHSSVVFMATGATHENITAFIEKARDFNVTVVLKKDILEGEDLDLLNSLSWDQRALVDYEIMLRAGHIAGPSQSSFTWNLAMRRGNAFIGPRTIDHSPPGNIQWQDQYSKIFGKSDRGKAMMRTIWP